MKIKVQHIIIIVLAVLAMSATKHKTTIFMIGDSTMANKPYDNEKPERGWGMALQGFFTDDIVVDNHAVNGRSSKSFIDEGRWQVVSQTPGQPLMPTSPSLSQRLVSEGVFPFS